MLVHRPSRPDSITEAGPLASVQRPPVTTRRARGLRRLTDEQRGIVEVTRAFVERELLPHEEEVERTGVLRPELAAEIRRKALAAGPVRRQHARGRGRCRPRHGDVGAVREGAGQGELCPALHRRGPPVEHPARRHAGPAGALPAPLRPRRAHRLPGHDRARGGLRHAGHPHARRAHRRRLEHPGHQALHQPRRRGRLRDPAGADRCERPTTTRVPACRCSWSTSTRPG